jgi:hypothetical protein
MGHCAALEWEDGRDALHEIALATLAFLDTERLRALWRQPAWLPCPEARWPQAVRQRLEMYRLIGERDTAGMLSASRSALATDSDSAEWRRYALSAGLLAARSVRDNAAVGELWKRHGRELYPDAKLSTEIIMLLSMK